MRFTMDCDFMIPLVIFAREVDAAVHVVDAAVRVNRSDMYAVRNPDWKSGSLKVRVSAGRTKNRVTAATLMSTQ